MIPYILDYTIEKIAKNSSNQEQKIIKQLTGKSLSQKEAGKVWAKVKDHKWYVSERLGRDVGLRVAAVDFIENIYEPSVSINRKMNNPHRSSQPKASFA